MILAIIDRYSSKIFSWYRYAKENRELSFWIVFALAVYLPFEEFLIKFIPVPGAVIFVFRILTTEFIIFVLFFKLLYEIICLGKPLKRTPLDILFITFLSAVTISILLNRAAIIESLINLRPLLRYVPLYYIVVHLDISKEKIALVLKTIRAIGLFQSCLACVQYLAPPGFNSLFEPRATGVTVAGYERTITETKVGAASGTMGRPATITSYSFLSLSAFLGNIYSKTKAFLPSFRELVLILIIIFSIFATLKRASLIIALLIPILILWHLNKRKKALRLGWFGGAIGLFLIFSLLVANFQTQSLAGRDAREEAIDPTSYIVEIFTPEYWEQTTQNARGWMIGNVGGSVLRSEAIWFGFSPAPGRVEERLMELNRSDPFAQERFERTVKTTLEDTYWIAMLAYYGTIGVLIYLLILWRLYRSSRWLTKNSFAPEYKALGSIFATVIIAYILYAWIERVWELKTISFYFWLLAGLVTNSCHALAENQTKLQQNSE